MSRPKRRCCCLRAQGAELFLWSGITNECSIEKTVYLAPPTGDWRPAGLAGYRIRAESRAVDDNDRISTPYRNRWNPILANIFRVWRFGPLLLEQWGRPPSWLTVESSDWHAQRHTRLGGDVQPIDPDDRFLQSNLHQSIHSDDQCISS